MIGLKGFVGSPTAHHPIDKLHDNDNGSPPANRNRELPDCQREDGFRKRACSCFDN
jgi:hypothetical protein